MNDKRIHMIFYGGGPTYVFSPIFEQSYNELGVPSLQISSNSNKKVYFTDENEKSDYIIWSSRTCYIFGGVDE